MHQSKGKGEVDDAQLSTNDQHAPHPDYSLRIEETRRYLIDTDMGIPTTSPDHPTTTVASS